MAYVGVLNTTDACLPAAIARAVGRPARRGVGAARVIRRSHVFAYLYGRVNAARKSSAPLRSSATSAVALMPLPRSRWYRFDTTGATCAVPFASTSSTLATPSTANPSSSTTLVTLLCELYTDADMSRIGASREGKVGEGVRAMPLGQASRAMWPLLAAPVA